MRHLDKTTSRQYLLGILPEPARDEFEQQWFDDKAKYYEMCESENNLIDEYVRGYLTSEERSLFEQHFLAIPARRERVAVAKSLAQEIDRQVIRNSAPTLWERLSAVLMNFKLLPAVVLTALMLLVAVGVWLFKPSKENQIQVARTETLVPPIQSEQVEPTIQVNSPKLIVPPTRIATPPTHIKSQVTLPLTILLRGENNSLPILKLAHGVTQIKLQVPLPANDYQRFGAILRTAEGTELKHWSAIKAKNHVEKLLELDATNLQEGDYLLIINGIRANSEPEEFHRLPFQVRK